MGINSKVFKSRIRLIKVLIAIGFLTVIWSSVLLLIPQNRDTWVRRGNSQFFTKIEILGERGEIYDRDWNPLALNVPGVVLYQTGKLKKIPLELSKYGIKPYKKVPKGKAKILAYGLPYSIAQTISEPGILVRFAWVRSYPTGSASSPVIGIIGREGDGLAGIEYLLNDFLKGRPGYRYVFRTADRVKFALPDLPEQDEIPGNSLRLTIDRNIQELVYELLREHIGKVSAKWGFVIVTNPFTGEVLAMVNYPSPNPNKNRVQVYPENHAITDPYEPGSTFKVILYTLAYETGRIKPSDTVNTSPGWVKFGKYKIHDVHNLGEVTYRDALVYSSNVAASLLSLKFTAKELYEMAQRFGIGTPTGISLPGESPGKILPLSKWTDIYKANFSFGHGVMVTGIQMASLYGAVANGGYLIQPHIIMGSDSFPRIIRRVTRRGVIDTLRSILVEVVERGTGRQARIPGIKIAGKTGTTEKVDPQTGKYSKKKSITSFIGFFPAENPRYLVVVVINEPQKGRFGGDVCAPLFKKIALQLINLEIIRNQNAKVGKV